MKLVFDLSVIAEPTPMQHVANAALILVFAMSAWAVFRSIQRSWRTGTPDERSQYWGRGGVSVFLMMMTVGVIVGEVLLLIRYDQRQYSNWLDAKDYQTATGATTELVPDAKFWETDPIPTFVVENVTFEYGPFSENRHLLNHLDGGPLQEGRRVSIWHHAGLILRVYAAD